jgi:hypothetical protein
MISLPSRFDEEQKRESSDSLTIVHDADGVPYTVPSDEVMDGALEGSSQQQISPEISEASRQKHLGTLRIIRKVLKYTSINHHLL